MWHPHRIQSSFGVQSINLALFIKHFYTENATPSCYNITIIKTVFDLFVLGFFFPY